MSTMFEDALLPVRNYLARGEHHVIGLILCILHSTQQRIRASTKHHIERGHSNVPLVHHGSSHKDGGSRKFQQ